MSHRRDFYEILEVVASASAGQLRSSFRRLARRWHPDANGGSREAEREFKRIGRAWETLGDPARRETYDWRHTQAQFAGPGGGERSASRQMTGVRTTSISVTTATSIVRATR